MVRRICQTPPTRVARRFDDSNHLLVLSLSFLDPPAVTSPTTTRQHHSGTPGGLIQLPALVARQEYVLVVLTALGQTSPPTTQMC